MPTHRGHREAPYDLDREADKGKGNLFEIKPTKQPEGVTRAGNYLSAATKEHLDKTGIRPNMYERIEKDMGPQRKAGVDRAMSRIEKFMGVSGKGGASSFSSMGDVGSPSLDNPIKQKAGGVIRTAKSNSKHSGCW